ncbi:hypothetical protein LTR56_012257 [Elasticomyces elasticus]|nr:hypothetical protein LTR56_012257 [Elasticomyces elasticus]KAK3653058.1 hypothetical protein LTR22_011446 [Elasticomyces elasticus]KAK4919545.1 hypothetical protein LTR49_012765 [Elasticomyces elasticus]KAK5763085.1 hypothetical protein LTS12_006674 [Elasticomyces elasticus]
MAAAAAATGPTPLMRTAAARLATFQHPQPTDLRRASTSTSRKKAANVQTATWPHESPSIEDLAKAGFFYLPLPHNPDNTKCFSCAVKLDGWEASDNPLAEHLAHAPTCPWALCKSVALPPSDNDDELIDPMSEAMVTARTSTFVDWPHEGKRGWRCKVSKMAEAGWCHDPSPEDEDGVTCFYCDVSLDGWEPKDDPWVEHERRTPGCRFFGLSKLHGHVHGAGVGKKGKAVKGGRSRAGSTASRVEVDGDLEEEGVEAGEDSVLSNATTASQATVKGAASKKKGGRAPKAAAKGRKRAATIEQEPEPELEPEPEQEQEQEPMVIVQTRKSQVPGTFPESSILDLEPEPETAGQQREEEAAPPPPPAKATRATRKGTRQSKQAVDSSVLEVSSMDVVPTKKATRGRKAKAPVVRERTSELEVEAAVEVEMPVTPEVDGRASDVSAQLQEELDHSILVDSQSQHEQEDEEMVMEPEEESTPQPAGRGKRGVKRTSEGVEKVGEGSVLGMEFPEPPAVSQGLPKGKGKGGKGKGRKGSKQIAPAVAAPVVSVEREVEELEMEVEMQDLEGGQEKDEESGNWEVFAAASEEPESQAPPAYEERAEREVSPAAEEVAGVEDEMTPEPARPSKKARVGGKGKKAPATKKAKGAGTRKASSTTRSSRTKKAESVEPEAHGFEEGVEDLDRDEREIEEEIARMGEEERSRQQDLEGGRRTSRVSPAVIIVREDEQDRVEEYEDSPIHHRSERRDEEVMDEVHDVPDENVTPSPVVRKLATATPSPNGSDKENLPSTSSLARPMTALKAPVQAPQFLSPTKTTRIPLAPGTPNRLLSSRRRQNQNIASPTKTSLRLESTMEWAPVDLDTVFLASPQAATPGTMLTRLVEVGGGLSEVERGMSVEEWVRWRAGKGEEELRRRCEGAVSLFEREGGRGVGVLEGVVVG